MRKQQPQHKPTAATQLDAAKERVEADRAERAAMPHGTKQSGKRPVQSPAEDGRAAAHGGQMPQNQQRLGQHQNSRKQP
ncbi:hypothetical protein ACN9M1_02765 [Ralstonia sp. R-29]|uniref:hypothetical protein n=1 Tax=Ralstonia sp. R-29 TaxID=3404059 RepID=UPI003CFAB197